MANLMFFGDIFYVYEYDENCGENHKVEYVYLYDIGDLMYCAKILNKSDSSLCRSTYNKLSNNPNKKHLLESIAFCYVELDTKEYKDRIVHLAKTDQNPKNCGNIVIRLNDRDIQDIKDVILERSRFFDQVLVDYIKEL